MNYLSLRSTFVFAAVLGVFPAFASIGPTPAPAGTPTPLPTSTALPTPTASPLPTQPAYSSGGVPEPGSFSSNGVVAVALVSCNPVNPAVCGHEPLVNVDPGGTPQLTPTSADSCTAAGCRMLFSTTLSIYQGPVPNARAIGIGFTLLSGSPATSQQTNVDAPNTSSASTTANFFVTLPYGESQIQMTVDPQNVLSDRQWGPMHFASDVMLDRLPSNPRPVPVHTFAPGPPNRQM